MRNWERAVFLLGFAAIVFLIGVELGGQRSAPYPQLRAAKEALRSLWETMAPGESPLVLSKHKVGGVTRWERGAAQEGLTLMAFRGEKRGGAMLVDMNGKELHRWSLEFSEAWPDAPHILSRGADDRIFWHGLYLFPNGDLLFNYDGGNFPPGGGTVLIDKDSKIKWKVARNTHHDLDVLPDRRIAVLSSSYVQDGIAACSDFFVGPYVADELLILSADGQVLDAFSLPEALCNSEWRATIMPQGAYGLAEKLPVETEDPLHANAVDVLTPADAAVFPKAKAGDYLISFRHLNMIVLIDVDTRLVKWTSSGQFVRQHDPDILQNGNLLVYDNLGGSEEGGRSRILEIDPRTQAVVWKYEGTTDDPFDAPFLGKQAKLANGNVLIASPREGRIFEVTGDARPRVVWEYVNLLSTTPDGGRVGYVGDPLRFSPEELPFLKEAGS